MATIVEVPELAVKLLRGIQLMVKIVRDSSVSTNRSGDFLEAARQAIGDMKNLQKAYGDSILAKEFTEPGAVIQEQLGKTIKLLKSMLDGMEESEEDKTNQEINTSIISVATAVKQIISIAENNKNIQDQTESIQQNGTGVSSGQEQEQQQNADSTTTTTSNTSQNVTSTPNGTNNTPKQSQEQEQLILDMQKISNVVYALGGLTEIFLVKSKPSSLAGQVAADLTKNSFELQVTAKLLTLPHYAIELKQKTTNILTAIKKVYSSTGQPEDLQEVEQTIKSMAGSVKEFVRASTHVGAQLININATPQSALLNPQNQHHSQNHHQQQQQQQQQQQPSQSTIPPVTLPQQPAATQQQQRPLSPRSANNASSSPGYYQQNPKRNSMIISQPVADSDNQQQRVSATTPPPQHQTSVGNSNGEDDSNTTSEDASIDEDPEGVIDDIMDTLDDAFSDLVEEDSDSQTDSGADSSPQPSALSSIVAGGPPQPLPKDRRARPYRGHREPAIPMANSSNGEDGAGSSTTTVTTATVTTQNTDTTTTSTSPTERSGGHVRQTSNIKLMKVLGNEAGNNSTTNESSSTNETRGRSGSVSGVSSTGPATKKSKTGNSLKQFFSEVAENKKQPLGLLKRKLSLAGVDRPRPLTQIAQDWDKLEEHVKVVDIDEAQLRNKWELNNQKKLEKEQMELDADGNSTAETDKKNKSAMGMLKRMEQKLLQSTNSLKKSGSVGIKKLYANMQFGTGLGAGKRDSGTITGVKRESDPAIDSPGSPTTPRGGAQSPTNSTSGDPKTPRQNSKPGLSDSRGGGGTNTGGSVAFQQPGILPVTYEDPNDPRAEKFEDVDSEKNIRLATDESVVGATVEKLIQRLTFDIYPDPDFIQSFLFTYRMFLTPSEFLQLIELRWNCKPPPGIDLEDFKSNRLGPIRLRIYNLLKTWLEKFYHDFLGLEATFFEQFENFLKKIDRSGMTNAANQLQKLVQKRKEGVRDVIEKEPTTGGKPAPSPFIPRDLKTFRDINPFEVARQLTLKEHELFYAISYHEFLDLSWTRKDKEKRAPNILSMIRFTNHVINWIITEILNAEDIRERGVILNRFIIIAQKCLELNNFNGAMEVLSALRNSSTYRLQATWNLLPDESWILFENLENMFEPDDNYKNYRAALERSIPPCLPYLGRYLSDLLFIEEKLPKVLEGTELINFSKLDTIAGVVNHVQMQQEVRYKLNEVPLIVKYIKDAEVMDEKKAYQISLKREARTKK